MAKETDMNFDYISNLRYIVEIKDDAWIGPLFTKRIGTISKAQGIRDYYNALKGFTARIHDTKTGKILEREFLNSN